MAVTVTARGLSLVSLGQPYNVDAAIIPSPDGKGRLTGLQKVTVAADVGVGSAPGAAGSGPPTREPAGLDSSLLLRPTRHRRCLLQMSASPFLFQS